MTEYDNEIENQSVSRALLVMLSAGSICISDFCCTAMDALRYLYPRDLEKLLTTLHMYVHVFSHVHPCSNHEVHVSNVITVDHEYTCTHANSSHTMYHDTHMKLYINGTFTGSKSMDITETAHTCKISIQRHSWR